MFDLIFVLGTASFFAVMLAFVAAIDRLGRDSGASGDA